LSFCCAKDTDGRPTLTASNNIHKGRKIEEKRMVQGFQAKGEYFHAPYRRVKSGFIRINP
jgi:hypothetical protein